MRLFKSAHKPVQGPLEICKALLEAVPQLHNDGVGDEKARDTASKALQSIRRWLCTEGDPSVPETHGRELTFYFSQDERTPHVQTPNMLHTLITHISTLDFEARKDVCLIFSNLTRRVYEGKFPVMEYVLQHPDTLERLISAHADPDITLQCAMMLREALRHEIVAKYLLYQGALWKLFDFVEMAHFEVVSETFCTLRDALTRHKSTCADFMVSQYTRLVSSWTAMFRSSNYVTRRLALRLLGELILDRANFRFMQQYITCPENMKVIMNALRDPAKNIQMEAFQIFKVFVANPNKPPEIRHILLANKERFAHFWSLFHADDDDPQVQEEKRVLSALADLDATALLSSAPSSSASVLHSEARE